MQTIPYEFDPATVDLLLEGLSELPFKRVHHTIAKMREIALSHLNPEPAEGETQTQARRLRKKGR